MLESDAAEQFCDAREVARSFLARWQDPLTDSVREDLAQDAAVEAWRRRGQVRDPSRFPAFVRTISRRLRYRALVQVCDRERRHAGDDVLEWLPAATAAPDPDYWVGGERVEQSWLLAELETAMAGLGALNAELLRGYYEGFSCSELADRYGMVEDCVKVRLHRSRRRLARELTGRAERARHRLKTCGLIGGE